MMREEDGRVEQNADSGPADASGRVCADAKRERRKMRRRRSAAAKAVTCVIVGVLVAVPAVFTNTAIGYMAPVAYIVLIVASFAYVQVLKRGLVLSAGRVGGECTRGEQAGFTVEITNKTILPAICVQVVFYLSDLFGGEGSTETRTVSLGPYRSKTYEYQIRLDHIGSYQVGVREVVANDLMGIFSSVATSEELSEVKVLPRLFDVSDLRISTDSSIEAKKSFTTVIDDGMDYSSVRDYQWGDPIKSIHWKLSSRLANGEYLTRLYETNANPGMAIIADFDAPEYDADALMCIYDTVVECAFSVERYASEKGLDAELIFRDKSKQRCRFFTPLFGKRRLILERMPKIFSPGSGKEALELVQEELNSNFAQSNLIVCTSVISEELVESLVAARSGKRTPILFAVVPDAATDERRREVNAMLKRLDSSGVYYRVVSNSTSLEQAV